VHDGEVDVDRLDIAVSEDGRAGTDDEANQEGAGEKESLPEVTQVGHPAKVTRLVTDFGGFRPASS
jgi:hypothetical protein